MKNRQKKIVAVLAMAVILLFLSSCINYKPYEASDKEAKEGDLLSEIAEIEKELESEGSKENLTENITKETEEVSEIAEEIKEKEQEVTIPLGEEVDRSKLQRVEIKENGLVNLKIKADDPDKDELKYTFSLPLNQEGKWKTNYGDAGEYVVTITVSDGKTTTKKEVLLAVKRVNVPPKIKEIKDVVVKEGETVKIEPEVIDPNGDSVTVTFSEPIGDNGVWATDHKSAGEYEIAVKASDGELESKETFLLKVTDVNVLPEITGLEDMTVKEGEKVMIKPTVTDLDNDPINLTISAPVGNDGIWETGYTDHGTYTVTITASDGKDKVTKTIKLTIEDVNMPPEIVEIKLG